MQITPEMMQMIMQMAGSQGGSGGQGLIPMLMGGGGEEKPLVPMQSSPVNVGGMPVVGGTLPGMNVNTPGINPDPMAQKMLNSGGTESLYPKWYQPDQGGTNFLGQKEGIDSIGAAQGISPGGAANNQFRTDAIMKPPPSTNAMGGGMDPKSKMMLMVAQQIFNQSQEEEQPLVPMGTSPVSVGGMPAMPMNDSMQMRRGTMPDYQMTSGGVLSDPNRRRQRRAQFLYGI